MRPGVPAMLCALLATGAAAQVQVPTGFSIRTLTDTILATNARGSLAAIRDDAYGRGVMVTILSNGTLFILRVDDGLLETFTEIDGFNTSGFFAPWSIEFDRDGAFGGDLVVVAWEDLDGFSGNTSAFRVAPGGAVTELFRNWPPSLNDVACVGTITAGDGFTPGLYLLDNDNGGGGESLYLSTAASPTPAVLLANGRPPGITNLGVIGFERDTTGLYGGGILAAEINSDQVFSLDAALGWSVVAPPQGGRHLFDLTISGGGSLGQRAYVADPVNGDILRIEPGGTLEVFASGLDTPLYLAAAADGDTLYVTDANGVHAISTRCSVIDLAEAFGVLDLSDVTAFAAAFVVMDPVADLDGNGFFELSDLNRFITLFLLGCP